MSFSFNLTGWASEKRYSCWNLSHYHLLEKEQLDKEVQPKCWSLFQVQCSLSLLEKATESYKSSFCTKPERPVQVQQLQRQEEQVVQDSTAVRVHSVGLSLKSYPASLVHFKFYVLSTFCQEFTGCKFTRGHLKNQC